MKVADFFPMPKSPSIKIREGANKSLIVSLFDLRQEADIITKPFRGFKKTKYDRMLKASGKFKKIKLW